jgi:hypothetical protein
LLPKLKLDLPDKFSGDNQ